MRISPELGCSRPAIIRSSVVFPQPDGPRSTRNSPSRVTRSTPSTARTSPNSLRTCRASTVAMWVRARAPPAQPGGRLRKGGEAPRRGLDQPLLLPLAEDPLAGGVGLPERVLWRRGAAGRLGEHHVQHPGGVDLVDGR